MKITAGGDHEPQAWSEQPIVGLATWFAHLSHTARPAPQLSQVGLTGGLTRGHVEAMNTTQIKIRVPTRRVKAVRGILASAGTDVGGIVNMLFAKIENTNAVPFEMFGRDPETVELLGDREFVDTLRKYRAGKLKMKPFRPRAK